MELTGKQRQYLKGLAHNLRPVVMIGANGITDAVLEELRQTLDRHELIKVKLPAADKKDRTQMLEHLSQACDAQAVQQIGRIAVLYRAADKPSITLPR